jgi:hypothetical protein
MNGKTPVKIVMCPWLKEFSSFKNTVASCSIELKEFEAELKATFGHKCASWPIVDYSELRSPLWYLDALRSTDLEHAVELIEHAENNFKWKNPNTRIEDVKSGAQV